MKTHLPQETHQTSVTQLNTLLSNLHILYMTTRNAHWNITDASFLSLHKLFEETYNKISEHIDDTAEHLRILWEDASAYFPTYITNSSLHHIQEPLNTWDKAINTVVDQIQEIIDILMTFTQQSDNDPVRQDFFIGMTSEFEKTKRLISSHRE